MRREPIFWKSGGGTSGGPERLKALDPVGERCADETVSRMQEEDVSMQEGGALQRSVGDVGSRSEGCGWL